MLQKGAKAGKKSQHYPLPINVMKQVDAAEITALSWLSHIEIHLYGACILQVNFLHFL